MNLAILTCSEMPDLRPYDGKIINRILQLGANVQIQDWDKVDVSIYDTLLIRTTWDYYKRYTEFDKFLDKVNLSGVKLINSVETVKSNIHKFYLKSLVEYGIKIIPTEFVECRSLLNINDLVNSNGWDRIIIKPAISAGSYLTKVFSIADIKQAQEYYNTLSLFNDILLQPYISQIEYGEISNIFFNGEYKFSVLKVPARGEFRIQYNYGGRYSRYYPTSDIIKSAEKVAEIFKGKYCYARVDGLLINDEFYLMEIEMIEPDLYLDLAEEFIDDFVQSIFYWIFDK